MKTLREYIDLVTEKEEVEDQEIQEEELEESEEDEDPIAKIDRLFREK